METRTKYAVALAFLTLFVLVLRLLVAYQVAEPGYESYFTLVQADTIKETGLPRYDDSYSYGGRTYAFNPLFYYLVALLSSFLPGILVLKILPNLLMATLIPLVYLISHRITANRPSSLIAAGFAGFAPILFTSYLNEAVPMSLAVPVAAALLLTLLDLNTHPLRAFTLTTILTFVSPVVWLFLPIYIAYLLILAANKMRSSPAYLELALFTSLLVAWYTLLTYKEALHQYGLGILAAIPARARIDVLGEITQLAGLSKFTLLALLYAVGLIPVVLGGLALYKNMFEKQQRTISLIAAFGLVTLIAAAIGILPLRDGLVLLSLAFIILAAAGLHGIIAWGRKTRFESIHQWFIGCLLVLFLLTSLLPSVATSVYPQTSPTTAELEALSWLRTQETGLIFAAPRVGFVINYVAARPYVADESYLLITNAEGVLEDIDTVYTTTSRVEALERLRKYGATHIFLGPAENARYPTLGSFTKDRECFPLLFQEREVLIFGVRCDVKEVTV